jgi:LysM repeat protein
MPVEPMPAPKLTAEPAPGPVVYVVGSGDCLTAIAAEYGVSAAAIAQANNITDPRLLRPGRKLRIPAAPVYFDGRPLASDAPTIIADGRATVPLRAVVESTGGSVAWEGESKTATADARGHRIAVTIGHDEARVDGGRMAMGAPAMLRCDRTVVPLRFLGDVLDLMLQYQDGVIHIASAR